MNRYIVVLFLLVCSLIQVGCKTIDRHRRVEYLYMSYLNNYQYYGDSNIHLSFGNVRREMINNQTLKLSNENIYTYRQQLDDSTANELWKLDEFNQWSPRYRVNKEDFIDRQKLISPLFYYGMVQINPNIKSDLVLQSYFTTEKTSGIHTLFLVNTKQGKLLSIAEIGAYTNVYDIARYNFISIKDDRFTYFVEQFDMELLYEDTFSRDYIKESHKREIWYGEFCIDNEGRINNIPYIYR